MMGLSIKGCELPEELVCSILLLLPLREAARTSILCKKWRFLWKSLPNLDLDYKTMSGNSFDSCTNLDEKKKRKKFMQWAEKIIFEDNTSKKIMSCRIAYPLGKGYYFFKIIHECVRNLASRRVEDLNIDFTCTNEKLKLPGPFQLYSFHYSHLPSDNSLKRLSLDGCRFHLPLLNETTAAQTTFSNLVSLSLGHRIICNVYLHLIVSTCLSLERLSLSHCLCPYHITITPCPPKVTIFPPQSKYLKLKHFEMISCDHKPAGNELIIEIHEAVNLESIGYTGGLYKTLFNNSAQPYKLRFGFDSSSPLLVEQGLDYTFKELPVAFPEIETLSLSSANIKENMVPKQLKTFSKLTSLDLDMNRVSPKGLFEVTSSILKASPLLSRFIIHLPCDLLMTENNNGPIEGDVTDNNEKDNFSFRHERLSDVEIDNFIGVQVQVDYIIGLLTDVVNLEKMMIIRQCRFHQGDELPLDIEVKEVYDLFVEKVPASTQLLVL